VAPARGVAVKVAPVRVAPAKPRNSGAEARIIRARRFMRGFPLVGWCWWVCGWITDLVQVLVQVLEQLPQKNSVMAHPGLHHQL